MSSVVSMVYQIIGKCGNLIRTIIGRIKTMISEKWIREHNI